MTPPCPPTLPLPCSFPSYRGPSVVGSAQRLLPAYHQLPPNRSSARSSTCLPAHLQHHHRIPLSRVSFLSFLPPHFHSFFQPQPNHPDPFYLSVPGMDDVPSRKRPRPVVSCLRCREKKLKCDRAAPCQNCVKAHCQNDCNYAQFPVPQPPPNRATSTGRRDGLSQTSSSATPPDPGPIEDLQRRVAKLEELVILHSGTSSSEGLQKYARPPI